MATPVQIAANRANAQHSTGPCSVEGKAVTRFNAFKHGVDAQSFVIPGEDPEELASLTAEFLEHLDPEGPLEIACTHAMTRAEWLRRRYAVIEAQLWKTLLKDSANSDAALGEAWSEDTRGRGVLAKLHRRQQAVVREYDNAFRDFMRLQNDRIARIWAAAREAASPSSQPPAGPQPAPVSADPRATTIPATPRVVPATAAAAPAVAPRPSWLGSEPPAWRL